MTNVLETIAQEAHSQSRASLREELRKAKSLSNYIQGLLAHNGSHPSRCESEDPQGTSALPRDDATERGATVYATMR